MSIGPTHLFGFCMLTSVDKMFIRFIFAKDMQLHYIWYYKILIKPVLVILCVHPFIVVSDGALNIIQTLCRLM